MKEIKLRDGHVKSDRYNYYVTRDGKVFMKDNRNGNIKEMFYSVAHGYRRIKIKDISTNIRRYYRVGRLVAEVYIPNDNPNFDIVNHIDGNKQNDCVENLEWCDISINTQHAYDTGLIKDRGGWTSTPYNLRYL